MQVTAAAAVNLATSSEAQLIVVVTDSGHTAAAVAKFRPRMPVISLVVPRVVKHGLAWNVKVRISFVFCLEHVARGHGHACGWRGGLGGYWSCIRILCAFPRVWRAVDCTA